MTDVQKQKDDKPKDGKDARGAADGAKKEESKESILPEEELVSNDRDEPKLSVADPAWMSYRTKRTSFSRKSSSCSWRGSATETWRKETMH